MSPATWQPSAGLPKAASPPPGAGAGAGPSLPVGGAGKRGVEEPPPTVDEQRVRIKRKAKVCEIARAGSVYVYSHLYSY